MPRIFKGESADLRYPNFPRNLRQARDLINPGPAATRTLKPRFLAKKKLEKAFPQSGEGGIRTLDAGITDVTVFETAAFNRSATSPRESVPLTPTPFNHLSTQLPAIGPHQMVEGSSTTVFEV